MFGALSCEAGELDGRQLRDLDGAVGSDEAFEDAGEAWLNEVEDGEFEEVAGRDGIGLWLWDEVVGRDGCDVDEFAGV